MGESRDTHSGVSLLQQDKCCDVCGAVGFEELVNSCSRCTIRRHFYCMRTLVRNKLEDWICELCLPKNDVDSLKSGQTENVLDSSRKVSFDLRRQVACKRQKAVETGKVKFLPTKEVIKLSSGLPKTPFLSTSNRPLMGSKSNGPCLHPKKERRNPTFLQLESVSVPRSRGVQISPSSRQHVVQIPNKSKEDEEKARTLPKKYGSNEESVSSIMAAKEVKSNVDAKRMNKMKEAFSVPATSTLCSSIIYTESAHVVPNKENVRKGKISDTILPGKELTDFHSKTEDAMRATQSLPSSHHANIISSGQNFHNVAEPENLNVPKTETWNRLKVSLYRPHAPSLYATWRGGFKFLDTATLGEYFGGFLARPPCRVHRKAYELSKKMPPILQVNLLQQCHLQAGILQNGCLDLLDIALYFFPADYMERSLKNYNQLFELMWMKNSVMISYIDDMELLIFTSKQLHTDSQGVFTRSNMDFFVGVFCRAKESRMNVHQKLPSSDEMEHRGLRGSSLCSVPFASTMVKLSVAGRSPGNPGAASVGGLIRDESGRWIVGYNLNLGICNCLAADLWALYQGLKFARDKGYKKVQVESDSATAVLSLKKPPSLLDPNRALIETCRALINSVGLQSVYDPKGR